jgi:lipopolysaccharide export system protein LptA
MHRFRQSLLLIILLIVSYQSLAQVKAPVAKDSVSLNKPNKDNTAFIEILNSEYTDIIKRGNESITKIIGNVKLRSGTDILYCDSAILFQERKVAEAYGNVSIEQADGTTAFSDYLKYTGGSKVVYLKGNVILSDPKNNTLWSEEVDYNLSTKIGKYYKEGTLQNEETILSSKKGTYNLKTKEARFEGDVVVNDPEYKATGEDLGYNTETKLVRFFSNAIVQSEASTLFAKPGSTYDALNKFANFKGRSTIIHESRFIEADEMKYNQLTGWAIGKGNVVAIDTSEKATIWCGQILYNDQNGKLQATIFPVIRRAGENDTLYQRGDTVFSEPLENLERPNPGAIDSAQLEMDLLIDIISKGTTIDSATIPFINDTIVDMDTSGGPNLSDDTVSNTAPRPDEPLEASKLPPINDSNTIIVGPFLEDFIAIDSSIKIVPQEDTLIANMGADATDTAANDITRPERPAQKITSDAANKIFDKAQQNSDSTQKPRYFLLYHNVLVYSDSAQAKCDSMRYSQADSLMIMYKNPVLWGKKAQIIGDTVYALLDSSKLYEVYVPKNAILIQQNGPEQAEMFDQVQGNKLHAFFINNELDSAIAFPNAATIYFSVDDDSAYIGASQATADRLHMRFKDRKVRRISYYKDFDQTMTPMPEVDPAAFRLERFNWRAAERPKDLAMFLEGVPEEQKKIILTSSKKD